jgi:predicted transcriptional regulator
MSPKQAPDIETMEDGELSDATKNMSPEELAEFLAAVEEGMADVAAGRTISAEAVRRWIESWDTDNELPPPECD